MVKSFRLHHFVLINRWKFHMIRDKGESYRKEKTGVLCQDYILGKLKLRYIREEGTGHIAMILLPEGMEDCLKERRKTLQHRDISCNAWEVGSLCHLALRHHEQGNGAGSTLKYGRSTNELKFVKQEKAESGKTMIITTLLEAEEGYQVVHRVVYTKGEDGIEVENTFLNKTGRSVVLDMMTSFSLDNLSPLQRDDAPYKLKLHRFRGGWSLEGKHVEETIEDLNLESPWIRAFPESERYGVLGSHPVKRWFPFACVEDREYGVYWAAQLGCNSSWQMELSRDGDCYSLSGGIADCEFGGWWKEIPDGGSFQAPKAYLSVSREGFEDVCQNLTGMFPKYVDRQPECEQNLPIIFNEWCTTWGNPAHEKMLTLADKLKELPVSYVVIDAGWSSKEVKDNDPQGGNGDWECDMQKFPQGLLNLSRQMKAMGFRMGIWMEFEVTTRGAKVHTGVCDAMHLYRNGEVLQTGSMRRFWDFRRKDVQEYLQEKVIDFLRENEISYLKVDYNGSIGSGCDGAESPGEGLRSQMQSVYEFFVRIRRELPELVIENCASGGHRLEPMMMGITAMSSFSDAHECREIPYIAANLHSLILPRQSQIWAVVSPELTLQEIQYRLVSTMLGRFCLSGNITGLKPEQWEEVKKAAFFYEKIKGIVKSGYSRLIRESSGNQHHLCGAQALLRNRGEEELLIVYHSFAEPPEKIAGELPAGNWEEKARIGAECRLCIEENRFEITPQNPWEGGAVYFRKKE